MPDVILANCGVDGCAPVPSWIAWPLGVFGAVVLVLTLLDLWRRR
jgi:hypothetical protein